MEVDHVNKIEVNIHDGGQANIALGNGIINAEQNNSYKRVYNIIDNDIKYENNKKWDYIGNWNARLFLHVDNEEKPLTLADAFIMPDYVIYKKIERIKFSRSDTLDQIIEKFVGYDRTSTMLITGVPGIGKSSITAWIANKYKDYGRIIILRFRDWESEELEKGLLKSVCEMLGCKNKDLDNMVLVLDGFDEIKSLNISDKLLNSFFEDIKDYRNFKCIITSRPAYINSGAFQNVLVIKEFDIKRIEKFYEQIKDEKLLGKEKVEKNLEVLGIPVILYMAIMSDVDIDKNPTKPEMYNRIFAEKGGIFDKFFYEGIEYDIGSQILRDSKNVKKYLLFLQEVAFKMFEKGELCLLKERNEYQIPKLEINKEAISILEFPIKHLFESNKADLEFVHRSVYEYFASEYIFENIKSAINISADEIAAVLGYMLKGNILSSEILEFLRYKVRNEINDKLNVVSGAFQKMLQNGMTYFTGERLKNVIDCEMCVFANMLEIIHLWEIRNHLLQFDSSIINYINYNSIYNLNLSNLNLEGANLSEAKLDGANLCGAKLCGTRLNTLSKVKINGSIWSNNDINYIRTMSKAKFMFITIEEGRKNIFRSELFPYEY